MPEINKIFRFFQTIRLETALKLSVERGQYFAWCSKMHKQNCSKNIKCILRLMKEEMCVDCKLQFALEKDVLS